jgi:hypothetical protein
MFERATREAAEFTAQRHEIEQRLGRMGARTVAGIDDVTVERLGQPAREARFGVPHDDDPHADPAQGDRGIRDRFALTQTRRSRGE